MFFMKQYFEWDEAKNRKNQKKHDVSFETASLVFECFLSKRVGKNYQNRSIKSRLVSKSAFYGF